MVITDDVYYSGIVFPNTFVYCWQNVNPPLCEILRTLYCKCQWSLEGSPVFSAIFPLSDQVFIVIVQLLSAIDVSATNSSHCSLSSAMSHSVILCLPDVFPNLVTLVLVLVAKVFFNTVHHSPSTSFLYIFFHLAATDKLFR